LKSPKKKTKNTEALSDYFYHVLPERKRFAWLMQQLAEQDGPTSELIDWLLETPEYENGDYEAIVQFADRFALLNPEAYKEEYPFVERKLLDLAFYRKDKVRIRKSLEALILNPVSGIDVVVRKALYQLLYHGYYEELLDYAAAVWKPLSASTKLLFSPEYEFINMIYLDKLEKQYDLLQKGDTSAWKGFLKEIKVLGYAVDDERIPIIHNTLKQDISSISELTMDWKKKEESLLILNIYFLMYMKEQYHVPFMFSDTVFNIMYTEDFYKGRSSKRPVFFIPYPVLDHQIAQKTDFTFDINVLEMFGKVWGLPLVYDFLMKFSLIQEPWYTLMTQNLAWLKKDMMKVVADSLWQMHFVTDWPGQDIPGRLAVTSDFFDQVMGRDYSETIEIISWQFQHLDGQERIMDEIKNDQIKKGTYRPDLEMF